MKAAKTATIDNDGTLRLYGVALEPQTPVGRFKYVMDMQERYERLIEQDRWEVAEQVHKNLCNAEETLQRMQSREKQDEISRAGSKYWLEQYSVGPEELARIERELAELEAQ